MRDPCGDPPFRGLSAGGHLRGGGLERSLFRGIDCVRCFCPFTDYPAASRPPVLGVYVDEEEAAAAAATAASPVSAAAAAAAELARVAAGKLLQQWGPRAWTDPRARRQLLLPGAGGIVVCSNKLLLRCSTLTGVCSSTKHLPAAATCCCFASQTPKGPLLVVGSLDGCLRVFEGRTLRLVKTLETTAVAAAAETALCVPYGLSSASAVKQLNPPYCGLSTAAPAQESGTRQMRTIRSPCDSTVSGTAVSSSYCSAATAERSLQQTPICLLLVGNNALLAGLGGGVAAAFFLENCRLAAIYRLPPSVRYFLQQQQLRLQQQKQRHTSPASAETLQQVQLQHCREQAAKKWQGVLAKLQHPHASGDGSDSVREMQLALEAQLPVCCLFAAEAERFVVMAVHPEGWRDIPPLCSKNGTSSNKSSCTMQRWCRSSIHAAYYRVPPPVAASTITAGAKPWGGCFSSNSNAANSHQPRAATETATDATAAHTAEIAAESESSASVASWPQLVFHQHTGACLGTLWGSTSRTLAVGLGRLPIKPHGREQHQQHQPQQQLCCMAVTTTHVHFWQQQGAPCSRRRLPQNRSTQRSCRQQQQEVNGATSPACLVDDAGHLTDATAAGSATAKAAASGTAAHLEQQQLLHEKRQGDATVCPSFLCGCRASDCQLAAATAAVTAQAAKQTAAAKPQTVADVGSPAAAAVVAGAGTGEGGCVGGVWWSLLASFSLPLILSQQQQQEESSLADAQLDWGSRLIALLPSRSISCCLLSWRIGEGGLELLPLRWVQVIHIAASAVSLAAAAAISLAPGAADEF